MTRNGLTAIAGGGIAGLAAALAIARRGRRVRVYERRSAGAEETGAGLQLSPNAMHALAAIGCAEPVEALASEPTEIAVREAYFGTQVAQFPLGMAARRRFGAPYLQIARQDLRESLLAACAEADIDIVFDTAVGDFENRDDRVRLRVGNGDTATAGALVVADGVHSRLAGRLGGDMPRYSGYVAWRCLVHMAALPESLRRPVTTLWLGDGAHVVTYPIRAGQQLNVLACARRERWTSKRWSQPADKPVLRDTFRRWHRDVRTILAACERPYVWALHHREPLETWHSGRVVAIGDACHPILPFAAQGAAQAIEDALVLARTLAEQAEPARAFAAFQQSRENRVRAVFDESRARAGIYHRGPVARLIGFALPGRSQHGAATGPGNIAASFDWLYGYDVSTEGAA